MADAERRPAVLVQANDKSPFEEWLGGIRDKTTRSKILRQIDKLTRNPGTQKYLQGIAELKIDLGRGYRVYCALLDQKTLVILIGGGDKSSQRQDIESARQLWRDFEESDCSEAALRLWSATPSLSGDRPSEADQSRADAGE